jgi:hypothetical protein
MRQGRIAVPRHLDLYGKRMKVDQETYVSGYKNAWMAYLEVYAQDIDHQTGFLEDVASGDPVYIDGWFAGRRDFETLVRDLISRLGRGTAQLELSAALGRTKRPNQTPEPTPTSVTISACAELAPAAVVAHL